MEDDVVIEDEVMTVLEAVPEFVDRYLDLVEAADDDPGAAATLTEFADYVADLVNHLDRSRPTLARCMGAIEALAGTSADAEDLVAGAFLDSLSDNDITALSPWLGPATRALVRELRASAQ